MVDERWVVGLHAPHAERQFSAAPPEVQSALLRQANRLARDPFRGTFIRLKQVPKKTQDRWARRVTALDNLFKCDLPGGWRALYTVYQDELRRQVLIIEVVSPTEYDRTCGY